MAHFDGQNNIDVREVIDRVEELRTEREDETIDAEDAEELAELESLLEDLAGNGGDHQWEGTWYPITLISEGSFEDYARDLAEDIGGVKETSWPNSCIDWEQAAAELQQDYTSVEFAGETYYYR